DVDNNDNNEGEIGAGNSKRKRAEETGPLRRPQKKKRSCYVEPLPQLTQSPQSPLSNTSSSDE
ncbi:10062_t:CDS:2, partial [Entrophospora sp. SA101]